MTRPEKIGLAVVYVYLVVALLTATVYQALYDKTADAVVLGIISICILALAPFAVWKSNRRAPGNKKTV